MVYRRQLKFAGRGWILPGRDGRRPFGDLVPTRRSFEQSHVGLAQLSGHFAPIVPLARKAISSRGQPCGKAVVREDADDPFR
jgi:hypothetical protein